MSTIPSSDYAYSRVTQIRMQTHLDSTWQPGPSNTTRVYYIYQPLASTTFCSLIHSDTSRDTRSHLFAQYLEGIAFLHDNGIAHRDIKPANLLVESYDPPKARVADFGCATQEKKTRYDRPGTIPYLAPEQTEGEFHDWRVDYWAVALVAFELLGHRPYDGKVNRRTWEEIQKRVCKEPKNSLAVCCQKMLQWVPEDRMSAKDALHKVLRRCGSPVIRDNGKKLRV